MKKIALAIATIALVGGSMTSCKKGENDPFLSLRSRKARLTGTWTISAGEMTTTTSFGGTSATQTTTYTATDRTVVAGGITTVYTVAENSVTIESDGTYATTNTETLSTVDGTSVPGTTAVTVTGAGNWAFMGKNKDAEVKNKEAIILNATAAGQQDASHNHTETFTGLSDGIVWVIDQLKNKEMIITVNYGWSDDEGDSQTTTGTTTWTQE